MVQATVSISRQKPRRHQTALRGQANVCSHTATATLAPPSRGILKASRPRNLSVSRAGQAKRRARSSKGDARLPGAFPRNRDLDGTRDRLAQRIGSVRNRFCTWAASAGSWERKPAVTGTAANQIVRGRAFAAGESCGIEVPDIDSRAMRSLFAPQLGRQLAASGRGWFNWCCTCFSLQDSYRIVFIRIEHKRICCRTP